MLPFRFGVLAATAPTMSAWRDRARTAEGLGYSALYISDHLDAQFGPLVATTVAAEATSTLHVGPVVLNNDLRNPVVLAKEIATLGLAAEGRVEVGLGAGWLRSDYEQAGIEYDEPAVRVNRLAESLTVMKRLWSEGEATFEGKYHAVRGASCILAPRRSLASSSGAEAGGSYARRRQADTVGINTSLASGRKAATCRAEPLSIITIAAWHGCARGAGSLQFARAADCARCRQSRRQRPRCRRTATMLGFPGEDALELPIVLIGTTDELCEWL